MPERRPWDADEATERNRERRRDIERRRAQQPVRVPADNVYALLERVSRRESVAARSDISRCALCGRPLRPDTLTIDHTLARALGGADSPENLQATCVRCNNLKSRLEGAVQSQRETGQDPAGVVEEVLAAIPNADERARFAAHPSVQLLLTALAPQAV
jgi:5-methylcytosine-specific restriction endonuclease McrA